MGGGDGVDMYEVDTGLKVVGMNAGDSVSILIQEFVFWFSISIASDLMLWGERTKDGYSNEGIACRLAVGNAGGKFPGESNDLNVSRL